MQFELYGKKCEFRRLTAKEGLDLKNAMLKASATNDFSVLDSLMLKVLEVDSEKNINTQTIELIFAENAVNAICEISVKFMEYAQSFLPKSLKSLE